MNIQSCQYMDTTFLNPSRVTEDNISNWISIIKRGRFLRVAAQNIKKSKNGHHSHTTFPSIRNCQPELTIKKYTIHFFNSQGEISLNTHTQHYVNL